MDQVRKIAAEYNNKTLTKFINVYQLQFKDFKPPGLGDYMRGCFHMLQVLRMLNKYCGTNVTFDMDMHNHPMSKYIKIVPTEPCRDYSVLSNYFIDSLEIKDDPADICYQHVLGCVVRYFNKVRENIHYAFCCKFQVFEKIEEEDKEFIRSRMIPSDDMTQYIDQTMEELGLTSKPFAVLHVRIRDEVSFGVETPLEADRMNEIETILRPHLKDDTTYLLITNHNDIKKHFQKASNIVSKVGAICHTGQDGAPSDISVKDTMLDFYLMSRSSSIVAYSEYNFTGFSLECSKLFNIPYQIFGPPPPPPPPPPTNPFHHP